MRRSRGRAERVAGAIGAGHGRVEAGIGGQICAGNGYAEDVACTDYARVWVTVQRKSYGIAGCGVTAHITAYVHRSSGFGRVEHVVSGNRINRYRRTSYQIYPVCRSSRNTERVTVAVGTAQGCCKTGVGSQVRACYRNGESVSGTDDARVSCPIDRKADRISR